MRKNIKKYVGLIFKLFKFQKIEEEKLNYFKTQLKKNEQKKQIEK